MRKKRECYVCHETWARGANRAHVCPTAQCVVCGKVLPTYFEDDHPHFVAHVRTGLLRVLDCWGSGTPVVHGPPRRLPDLLYKETK